MDESSGVHVLDGLEDPALVICLLVDDVLLVNVFEEVGTDDSVQIRLHEVEHKVEVLIVFGADDVEESDDVGMACEFLQEHDLIGSSSTSRKVR